MPETPEVGSLWERDDQVYRVEDVYEAQTRDGKGGFKPVTLVRVILVEPMPWDCHLTVFQADYTPYDADGEDEKTYTMDEWAAAWRKRCETLEEALREIIAASEHHSLTVRTVPYMAQIAKNALKENTDG